MNNTLKKIIKGTLAIFAIKLILVTGIFIFQSCQSESMANEDQKEAKTNFLASLRESSLNLNTVAVRNSKNNNGVNIMTRDMQGATETVCLMEFNGSDTSADIVEDIVDNIDTVTELIQAKTSHNLITQFDSNWNRNIEDNEETDNDATDGTGFNPEDCIALIEIPLQPVVDALDPAIEEAKNYLISSYGFNNQEINDMIANENGKQEDLVPLVMAMVNAENNNNSTAFNYMSIFGEVTYAQDWEQIGHCAMVAIGADVLYALASESGPAGSKWTKKAIKKAFGTVAKRMLGPIGVAIAVVSFAMCMGGI